MNVHKAEFVPTSGEESAVTSGPELTVALTTQPALTQVCLTIQCEVLGGKLSPVYTVYLHIKLLLLHIVLP